MPTLRWNAMLGEWVIVVPHRATRPFQESNRECPFCPGQSETTGNWQVLTLDNKFPSLVPDGELLLFKEDYIMETQAHGYCKVIVISKDHNEQIETMSDEQICRVFKEFNRVVEDLTAKSGIEYVFLFENRGRSIGVSLDHPHAQVYALPFVPPRIGRELERFQKLWSREQKCLVCQTIDNEMKSKERIIQTTDHFVSLVPFGARLPYEVHIYPRSHVGTLNEVASQLQELGLLVRDTIRRYAKIFSETAYVMAFHTRPVIGNHPYWHFHIEFYPPWREPNQLKYLAGIETGVWTYTNDSLPEEKARELREAIK